MKIFCSVFIFMFDNLFDEAQKQIRLSKLLILCCCCIVITSFDVHAAKNFTSVQNGNWGDASTWDRNEVPGIDNWPNDKVTIEHDVTKSNSLTMNGSSTRITINTGGSLTVANTFYVGSGKLIMATDSQLTANIIELNTSSNKIIDGTITSTGNMEIDGHFTGSPTIDSGGTLLLGAQSVNLNFDSLSIQTSGNMTVQNANLSWTSGTVSVGGNFILKGTGDVEVPTGGNLTVTGTLSVSDLRSIDGPTNSGSGGIVSWGVGDVIISGNNLGLNNCQLPYTSPFDLSSCSVAGIGWKWIGDTTAVVTDYEEAFAIDGAPINLVDISARLDENLLSDFYGMVPEGIEVDLTNELLFNNFSNISVKDDLAEGSIVTVKVTFLNEAAGYKSALGYFVYQTDTPPASIHEIEHVIIMPNTSKTGSGGSLDSGDQIDLMIELTAGQSIGFFINSNGWDGIRGKQKSTLLYDQPFYTLESLNPNVGLGQRYHVVFSDTRSTGEGGSGFFAYGFEDILTTGGDKDFNDLIFNVEVTPIGAIDNYEEAIVVEPVTSQVNTKSGMLAFEDNWPMTGDYDFNDAVLSYDITTTLDGYNNNDSVKSISITYGIQAVGATFHSGLALRIPGLNESMIENVTIEKTINGSTNTIEVGSTVTTYSASGASSTYDYPLIKDSSFGDSSVSFTLSEDLFEELTTFDGTTKIYETYNCLYKSTTGGAKCPENTSSAVIKLTVNVEDNLLLTSVLGDMPFDHYLFGTHKNDLYAYSRKNSVESDWFTPWKAHNSSHAAAEAPGPGKYLEIHLKEFSTGTNVFEAGFSLSNFINAVTVDATSYLIGNPFISTTGNLPWVLDLPSDWRHPREGVDIILAYPNFDDWAENNAIHTDWYDNTNENLLYVE
jgi:LruC domain-containing protein